MPIKRRLVRVTPMATRQNVSSSLRSRTFCPAQCGRVFLTPRLARQVRNAAELSEIVSYERQSMLLRRRRD